jgi:hypothetical protein
MHAAIIITPSFTHTNIAEPVSFRSGPIADTGYRALITGQKMSLEMIADYQKRDALDCSAQFIDFPLAYRRRSHDTAKHHLLRMNTPPDRRQRHAHAAPDTEAAAIAPAEHARDHSGPATYTATRKG